MPTLKHLTDKNDLVAMTIDDLRSAYLSLTPGERLLLPTIQRSLVWDNKRIVDYWDTLHRGWFPGMMMVRQLEPGKDVYSAAVNSEVKKAAEGDFELFDGQQRMAAILLGFGEGPLAKTHRLWFGVAEQGKDAPRAAFRISTTGQPFGYRIDDPNSKLDLNTRREALNKLIGHSGKSADAPTPEQLAEEYQRAFDAVGGNDLASKGDRSWHPLADLLGGTYSDDRVGPAEVQTLSEVSCRSIAVKGLFGDLSEDDYEEFFRRTGQGGVALTEDELTYSMIKKRFPEARPAFEEIATDPKIGTLASATDMALGTLRLARIKETHDDKDLEEHVRVTRPGPKWVRGLADGNTGDDAKAGDRAGRIVQEFRQMLEPAESKSPRRVERLLEDVRSLLTGSTADRLSGNGMPRLLLAGLPKEMIDIAVMMVGLKQLEEVPEEMRRAFALWTLLFADAHHVAWHLAVESGERTGLPLIQKVIAKLESWNNYAALPVPSTDYLERLQSRSCAGELLTPGQLFPLDEDTSERSIAFLNDLHFWNKRGKTVLLFLQRTYIETNFPGYDPTSRRDEDLPIDLDHIIPRSHFDFRWSSGNIPFGLNEEQGKVFNEARKGLSDRIGNLRWLCASANRAKGNRPEKLMGDEDRTIEECQAFFELGQEPDNSDRLKRWKPEDVLNFQQIVLQRTARLAAEFIDESGIRALTDFERPDQPHQ